MKIEPKTQHRIDQIYIICLAVIIFGTVANFLVITNNDCKMPVNERIYWRDSAFVSHPERYFPIEDNATIPYKSLGDVLPLSNYGAFSIGDALIITGLIGMAFNLSFQVRRLEWGVK